MSVDMPTTIDQKDELVRVLGRLGIGLIELITSLGEEIVVLDRQWRVVAIWGDWPDLSPRRPEDLLGKKSREMFEPRIATIHEAAHVRALRGEYVEYEWTRRQGRQPVRLSTTASPLRDSSSKIVGIILITRKIPSLGREKGVYASLGQEGKRLLELEQGIQQLAGSIENYRKTGQTLRDFRGDRRLHQLSSRERQVLDLLGQGYRPRSIAEKLHVSPETVRNHLKAMFKKTGTHSQEELTAMLRASD